MLVAVVAVAVAAAAAAAVVVVVVVVVRAVLRRIECYLRLRAWRATLSRCPS